MVQEARTLKSSQTFKFRINCEIVMGCHRSIQGRQRDVLSVDAIHALFPLITSDSLLCHEY